jgi:hypothetical protein
MATAEALDAVADAVDVDAALGQRAAGVFVFEKAEDELAPGERVAGLVGRVRAERRRRDIEPFRSMLNRPSTTRHQSSALFTATTGWTREVSSMSASDIVHQVRAGHR